MKRYKLDVKRDVDPDGSGGYILNLCLGFASTMRSSMSGAMTL
jgi:hypothetical protein